jgi:hypothetical protein
MDARSLAAFLVAGAALASAAATAQPIRLADRVELSGVSGATDAVREQCGLQTSLPEWVRSAASDVELVSGKPQGGRVLELRVIEVHAPGGGPFSGPKWMLVGAELKEGGRTVASARGKRVTAEPFGGTCGQLQKVGRAIAVDIGAWLSNPTAGAELGDR